MGHVYLVREDDIYVPNLVVRFNTNSIYSTNLILLIHVYNYGVIF